MDAKATGRFIAELRKQKGYTQKELAEKIMVTDKAICSVIAFVLSFVPLFMFGSDGMTMISYVISAAMAVSICFQAVANRRELSAA